MPKVYGDKPINVVVKRSEEVAQFIGVALENGKYNEGSIIDRMQKNASARKAKRGKTISFLAPQTLEKWLWITA